MRTRLTELANDLLDQHEELCRLRGENAYLREFEVKYHEQQRTGTVMNKERLTTLANHLRTVPPETLDMSNWTCGTAACAVGHACMMPEFNAQGLGFPDVRRIPYYAGESGWCAVDNFFDLLWPAARHLFESRHYLKPPTPTEVADRIDYFVEHDGAVNIYGELV